MEYWIARSSGRRHRMNIPNSVLGAKIRMLKLRLTIVACALTLVTPAFAARCGGNFNSFIARFSAEAQAAGISPEVSSEDLSAVTQDPAGLAFDPRQHESFRKTFEEYGSTRGGPGRINGG